MASFRLHVRYSLLVAFASNLLRYGVVAVVGVGLLVVLRRWLGASPGEVRADLPEAVLIAIVLVLGMSLYKTWRRSRRRGYYDRYNRTRYV